MTHKKHPYVYRRYWQLFAAAIFFIVAVFILFVFLLPAFAETAPSTQHWELLNDGDQAYLLTQPGCFLTEQELGEDSRVFTLDCDPAKK